MITKAAIEREIILRRHVAYKEYKAGLMDFAAYCQKYKQIAYDARRDAGKPDTKENSHGSSQE